MNVAGKGGDSLLYTGTTPTSIKILNSSVSVSLDSRFNLVLKVHFEAERPVCNSEVTSCVSSQIVLHNDVWALYHVPP